MYLVVKLIRLKYAHDGVFSSLVLQRLTLFVALVFLSYFVANLSVTHSYRVVGQTQHMSQYTVLATVLLSPGHKFPAFSAELHKLTRIQ
jgi:hypothetical protein